MSTQQNTTVIVLEMLLDADAIAAALGVSKQTVARMWKSGSMPSPLRVGRRRLAWRPSEILKWLESKKETESYGDHSPKLETGNNAIVRR